MLTPVLIRTLFEWLPWKFLPGYFSLSSLASHHSASVCIEYLHNGMDFQCTVSRWGGCASDRLDCSNALNLVVIVQGQV